MAPRVRVRWSSDLKDQRILYRWGGDGFANIYDNVGSWPSVRDSSYIVDVVGTPKTHRVKPVYHESLCYRGLDYQPFVGDYGNAIKILPGLHPGIQVDLFSGDVLRVPHSSRIQAAGRAFTFFSERFPTKISGAEFAQGLREIGKLLPKLEKTASKTIASGVLTGKFGWENLLSDLNTLGTLVGSIRSRMEFLKRTYGKPTKLYFREPEFHYVEPYSYEIEPVRGFGVRHTLQSYRADFTASASLLQQLGHIDDAIGWMRALTISLGINNPLLAIWQVSRLSFVVDWFADVSGHLRRLASIQPADGWTVYNVSSSVVWNARYNVTQVNRGMFGGIPDQELFLGHLDVKSFERWVGLPVDLTIYTPSTCTPDQLVLLGAMVAAK